MYEILSSISRRVPLMEQQLLTLSEKRSSSPVFSGIRVTRSLVVCVCFVDRCLSFCNFLLAIVLSVLLRFTDSDYHFGIFKFYLETNLSKEQRFHYCSTFPSTIFLCYEQNRKTNEPA